MNYKIISFLIVAGRASNRSVKARWNLAAGEKARHLSVPEKSWRKV